MNILFQKIFLEEFNINIKSKIIFFCLILCLILSVSSVSASTTDNTTDQAITATTDTNLDSVTVSSEDISVKNTTNTAAAERDTSSGSSVVNEIGVYSGEDSILPDKSQEIKSVASPVLGASNDDLLSSNENQIINVSSYEEFTQSLRNNVEINITQDIEGTGTIWCSYNNTVINGNHFKINYQIILGNNTNNITFKNIHFRYQLSLSQPVGGIISSWYVSNVLIENCHFDVHIFYNQYFGGLQNLTVNKCNFTNCSNGAGAGIYIGGHNTLPQYKYDGISGSVNVQIYNCLFVNGILTTNTRGSAIELNSLNTTVENCTFINCSNTAKGSGTIGLYSTAQNALIYNCTFINNTMGYNGGAISSELEACKNCTIMKCTFINNTATGKGGAIAFAASNSRIINCTFENNHATIGGAISFTGLNNTIDSCIFINNTATDDGGAVYFGGENCNITNCNLINNSANEGGAIKFNAKYGYMGFCNYTNSSATVDGGALCSNAENSTVESCNFKNNTAPLGKDFYAHGTYTIKFIGLKFDTLFLTNNNSA